MKVWAVANQKGGVGKTTTAVTLGGFLAARGYKTLLVDIDPHGSLTSYFGYSADAVERGVYTLFQHRESDPFTLISPTRFDHLHILPASMALATLDRQLGTQSGMGLVLHKALQQLGGRYDYALIDCPPVLGVLMVNALAACDHLLIPVQTEFLALKGLERMLRTLGMITRSRNIKLPFTIVPTMFDRRTRASTEALQQLQSEHQGDVWSSVVPIDTKFREASREGVPLSMMLPQARGAVAYHQLLDVLLSGVDDKRRSVAL